MQTLKRLPWRLPWRLLDDRETGGLDVRQGVALEVVTRLRQGVALGAALEAAGDFYWIEEDHLYKTIFWCKMAAIKIGG